MSVPPRGASRRSPRRQSCLLRADGNMKPWNTSIVFCLIFVWGMGVCTQTLFGQATPTGSWMQLSSANGPARQGSAIVYDSVHNQTVLFGGEDSSGVLHHDTWVFNGTTWTQLNPIAWNPPRSCDGF